MSERAVLGNIGPRSWQYPYKNDQGLIFPSTAQANLVSSLLYGTRAMLVLNLLAFESKKYTAYDRFHGNGPYGKIPANKEPIRTLGFDLPWNKLYLVIVTGLPVQSQP